MSFSFSLASNGAANAARSALDSTTERLTNEARQLASGLRINSAADDPSGLAISQSLTARVNGFERAQANVQSAADAVNVADGALASVTDILTRIRTLAVEASSSIESNGDRANLQAEVSQLLLEIDRISQGVNFNGAPLLDGSHAGFVPAVAASVTVQANSVLATNAGPPGSNFGKLVADVATLPAYQRPIFYNAVTQNVPASTASQTVSVGSTVGLVPGDALVPAGYNGPAIQVLAVDPSNDTITAIFPQALSNGAQIRNDVNGSLVNAVTAGENVVTISGTAQPLYVGQELQLPFPPNAEVVTVQQVLGPTTFVADFAYAHPAGDYIGSSHFDGIAAGSGPGSYTITYGTVSNPSPPGQQVDIIDAGNFPAGVYIGTVLSYTSNSYTLSLPTAFPSGAYALAPVGNGTVSDTYDGSIKLQVVNTGVSITVQESFYNTATQQQATSATLLAPGSTSSLFDGVSITLGSFTSADIGSTAYVKALQASAAQSNPDAPALNVLAGASEGDTIALSLPAVTAGALRVAAISLVTGSGTDPTLAAEDAIGQSDFAIQQVLAERAGLGAFSVRLQEDESNDALAALNLQASVSTIRDLNVGAATTRFTQSRIEEQVGTAVLAQANALPETFLALFR